MKKKLVATLASVCLVAVLGVGATLAYYTAESAAKVNTFTVGNVDISVVEPEWDPDDGKNLVPGAEVSKNPMITNTGATEGYMMIEVDGMAEMAAMGFSVKNGTAAGYNTTDWVLVDEKTGAALESDGTLVDGFYVYKGTVEAGKSTSSLFTSVVLSKEATEQTATKYQVIGNFEDANGLFTYKTVDGAVIEANKDRVPNVDDAGNPIVKYTINGVDEYIVDGETVKSFNTYAAAQAYVLDPANKLNTEASFVFDLTLTGYAIQSENVAFQDASGNYAWVKELVPTTETETTN